MRRWTTALVVLGLLGCTGGGRPAPTATETADSNKPWFCQMQGYDGWQCARGEAAGAAPRPERLPESRRVPEQSGSAQAAAPEMTGPAQTPDGAAVDPASVGTRATAEAATEPAPAPAALPAYAQLAYQPQVPTALVDLPPDFYAVQLIAMRTPTALESFARHKGLPGLSAARVEKNGELYFVLLLGIYETLADAEAAVAGLPPPLADVTPWIRPLGSLQAAMLRAEALPD